MAIVAAAQLKTKCARLCRSVRNFGQNIANVHVFDIFDYRGQRCAAAAPERKNLLRLLHNFQLFIRPAVESFVFVKNALDLPHKQLVGRCDFHF